MSSRALRRLQGKDALENIDNDVCDDESDDECIQRPKVSLKNPFGLLIDDGESSDETEVVEEPSNVSKQSGCRKKKINKKTLMRKHKVNNPVTKPEDQIDDEFWDESFLEHNNATMSSDVLNAGHVAKPNTPLLYISVKNLNINYELKKIFGASTVGSSNNTRRSRGKLAIRSFCLVNPSEAWPPLNKTGITMKMERTDDRPDFQFVHSPEYQKIQLLFMEAVNSHNPDNVIAILNTHHYHIDALIQLSDLCKLGEDLQVAVQLNERALYCLENAFHHQFNISRGNCHLDYRYQVNRPFFICLFKRLMFVGERACYKTALELCKLLLLLDFETDPLAAILCIDFYALRSQNYEWLIQVADEWESKKNLSQLPNFAFSTALANFHRVKAGKDLSVADRLLQDALILFPGVLKPLLDKCNVESDSTVSRHSFFSMGSNRTESNALKVLTSLYVNRTFHEWKDREILSWLERNVHCVLERVDSNDPFVEECARRRQMRYTGIPTNILRHIILSDIQDVTTLITDGSSSFLSFDPLPPPDSINIYHQHDNPRIADVTPSLALFFRSIMPSFNINNQQDNA